MTSGINIYSKFMISRVRIYFDISNWITDINICWYQEFKYWYVKWYQEYIVDIRNSFADINNWNTWYKEFEFFISTLALLIWRITITAMLHYWYQ